MCASLFCFQSQSWRLSSKWGRGGGGCIPVDAAGLLQGAHCLREGT